MKDKVIKIIVKYSEPLGDAYHRKISPSAIKEAANHIIRLYPDKSESDVNADVTQPESQVSEKLKVDNP